MKSKVAQRIIDETSQKIKDDSAVYASHLIERQQFKDFKVKSKELAEKYDDYLKAKEFINSFEMDRANVRTFRHQITYGNYMLFLESQEIKLQRDREEYSNIKFLTDRYEKYIHIKPYVDELLNSIFKRMKLIRNYKIKYYGHIN